MPIDGCLHGSSFFFFFLNLCLLTCSLPWKVGDSVEGEMPRLSLLRH